MLGKYAMPEGCFRVDFDGIKYPFITTTAEVLADAVEEFKASRHYVPGHPLQDLIWITRINIFGKTTHSWEMDMVSGHFKVVVQPQHLEM